MIPAHPGAHLIVAAAFLAVAAALILVVRNRVIRRRLLFSSVAVVATGVVHGVALAEPDWSLVRHAGRIEILLLTLGAANGLIALAFNPWTRDGESDRAPAIVQDALAVAAGILTAVLVFDVSSLSFLTGSAIVAAIVGFALQDTLGNAFAGIAIQIERPFRVGHWIAAGEHVGLVMEMTWRATKVRTKAGNLVAVPNSVLAGQPISNYSEPTAPTRLQIDIGAAYGAPPNEVRAALLAAASGARHVLDAPAPEVMLRDFGASSIDYRLWVWVDDFSKDDQALDAVRTRIYYEFRRRGVEIPFPIQVEYSREEAPVDRDAELTRFTRSLERVPVLATLPAEAHRALAAGARELLYADREQIVREGEPGASMFIVDRGSVVATVGPDRREVAVTTAGGYFGEMSLLTGDARSATVTARGDAVVLEITADAFKTFVQSRPEVLDSLAAAASTRRRELDAVRAAAGAAPPAAGPSLVERMRQYFGLR